jgi:hypothetical protein
VFDPAACSRQWCEAINALTPHKAYNVVYYSTYVNGGQDAILPKEQDKVAAIIKETDILVCSPGQDHGHFGAGGAASMDPASPACTYYGPHLPVLGTTWAQLNKPIIIWLWGAMGIRCHLRQFHEAFDRWPTWASDEDIAVEGGWPCGVTVRYLPWIAPDIPKQDGFVISHTASDPRIKNTSELMAACSENPGATVDLISGLPFRDAVARKASSHLHFDHMQGYTGGATWESTAMGLPNIVGLHRKDYRDARMKAWQTDTLPPWYICRTKDDVSSVIGECLRDPLAMQQRGTACKKWHDDHFKVGEFVERFFIQPATQGRII